MMLVFLTMYASLLVYHVVMHSDATLLRLAESGQYPSLSLDKDSVYHLFLSHIWSSGQDQVAVIKRKLQLMLPGCRIFLDVDDLEEIGALDTYIKSSQCVLIFLSRGYFVSANVLREVDAALDFEKPLVLVHEKELSKGGVLLETLHADLARARSEACVASIFDSQREIITWLRVAEFQQLSLKRIAERMLYATPLYARFPELPKLCFPGELALQHLEFHHPAAHPHSIKELRHTHHKDLRLFVSGNNPGAADLVVELKTRFGSAHLTVEIGAVLSDSQKQQVVSTQFRRIGQKTRSMQARLKVGVRVEHAKHGPGVVSQCMEDGRTIIAFDNGESHKYHPRSLHKLLVREEPQRAPSGTMASVVAAASLKPSWCSVQGPSVTVETADQAAQPESTLSARAVLGEHPPDAMLLYLSRRTFVGLAGVALAHEVRRVRKQGVHVVLAHEIDERLHGCDFARLFETTPQDLIRDGLYKTIATPLHPQPYRDTSLALLAKAIGARRHKAHTALASSASGAAHAGTRHGRRGAVEVVEAVRHHPLVKSLSTRSVPRSTAADGQESKVV